MRLTLDFEAGLLVYRLAQTDRRGKVKETVAEVPGLFGECTLAACFGGKSQRLTVHSCKLDQGERGDVARRGDAFGLEDRVAPLENVVYSPRFTPQTSAETVDPRSLERLASIA